MAGYVSQSLSCLRRDNLLKSLGCCYWLRIFCESTCFQFQFLAVRPMKKNSLNRRARVKGIFFSGLFRETSTSPAAFEVIAGTNPGLETGSVPLLALDSTNQVNLLHSEGFDTQRFCLFSHVLYFHGTALLDRCNFLFSVGTANAGVCRRGGRCESSSIP
jgi:hypothetical protein